MIKKVQDSEKNYRNTLSDPAIRQAKRNNWLLIRENFYFPHLTGLMTFM